MKGSPIRLKQKLSPKAAAAKKRRDIAMAKTTARKAKKAENQRLGQRSNSDIHHMPDGTIKRVSIKNKLKLNSHYQQLSLKNLPL